MNTLGLKNWLVLNPHLVDHLLITKRSPETHFLAAWNIDISSMDPILGYPLYKFLADFLLIFLCPFGKGTMEIDEAN